MFNYFNLEAKQSFSCRSLKGARLSLLEYFLLSCMIDAMACEVFFLDTHSLSFPLMSPRERLKSPGPNLIQHSAVHVTSDI